MSSPPSPWRGRLLAFFGIALLAFSLRTAVASFSPLLAHIAADFPVSPLVVGLVGAAPPVCFAIFGLLTPAMTARWGLERVSVIALSLITVGMLGRSFAAEAVGLMANTAVIFAGVAIGNVVLPPLVKKYFPDRLSTMMTVYTTMLALSTFLPPLFAVPIADATGWRVSLGAWALFAVAALVPWVALLVKDRTPQQSASAPAPPVPQRFGWMWRLAMPWAITVVFATSAILAYVGFGWLPVIAVERAGVETATAGMLLSVYGMMGLPAALLVPLLVVRLRATRALFFIAVVATLAGLLGFLVAPAAAPLLWTALAGLQGILFPLSLVLISIRASTVESAAALSGFVQSIGYAVAAPFPFLMGVLTEVSGGWDLPLLVLIGVVVLAVPFGVIAGRRMTVEEERERRQGARREL